MDLEKIQRTNIMNYERNIERERLGDFVKILTFHLVSKIRHHFNSDLKAYFDAPGMWMSWHEGKAQYNPRTYELMAKFNATALDSRTVSKIFGWSGKGKRLPYEEILKDCPDVDVFNKCTVVVKGQRHNVCRRYRLKRQILEGIFADEALLKKVLDAKSDFYTKRQRKLIFGSLLGEEPVKHEEEGRETMNETNAIDVPEDDLPRVDETAQFEARIEELKSEIRRLRSENAALKERAYANRPIFSDGFDFEGQTKAMKELLDECWEECRAEKESGKKAETPKTPAKPKPSAKPEPRAVPAAGKTAKKPGTPSDDIPATPPGKSKLYGRLQEFVFKHFISAAEAERISECAYRAKRRYREASDGFCASHAAEHSDARRAIARMALAENPFLLNECDDAAKKFVGRLALMIRAGKTKGGAK